jgi:hypothetical protein
MKTLVKLLIFFIAVAGIAQNNLLDTSNWTVGQGNVDGYTIYGPNQENERINGIDPYENTSVLWVGVPSGDGSQDGGVYSPYVNIDPTKTYRLSIWMKKTGSNVGGSYFGLHIRDSQGAHSAQNFGGSINSNPYFMANKDLPQLDKWYLLVAFVHPTGYSGASQAAIYDSETGAVVTGISINDYKFGPGSSTLRNRALLWKDTNVGDRQYYWNPAIYEVNNQEPSIQELLDGPNSNPQPGTSVWLENNTTASYNGEVAIGRNTVPAGYKLAVDGHIRTREVRVDQDTWPDYVFDKDYDLLSLEEIQKYINEKGHLPNIPSAKEVKTNGLEIGEMNKLLLEKIEELTLHILKQEERIKLLEQNTKTSTKN